METLTGHTSPETACTMDDYPYGFRLRTSIRYWIETKPGYGQRMVSQTLNPKTGRWNKPKAGTYTPITVLLLDINGHVHGDGLSAYADENKIADFEHFHADALGNREREIIRRFRASHRAQAKMTWRVHTCHQGCTENHQTIQEQTAIIRKAT